MTSSVLRDGEAQRADILPERKEALKHDETKPTNRRAISPGKTCYYCTAAGHKEVSTLEKNNSHPVYKISVGSSVKLKKDKQKNKHSTIVCHWMTMMNIYISNTYTKNPGSQEKQGNCGK